MLNVFKMKHKNIVWAVISSTVLLVTISTCIKYHKFLKYYYLCKQLLQYNVGHDSWFDHRVVSGVGRS